MTRKPDYYKILQIDQQAEVEVVKAAYKRLAAKYHPDVSKDPNATNYMQQLNEAYEVIINPTTRAKYDSSQKFLIANKNHSNKYSFTFPSGDCAIEPENLATVCMYNWFDAVLYFYDPKQFLTWFKKIHRHDLIPIREKCLKEKNIHEALYVFLQHLNPALPQPSLELKEIETSISIEDFEIDEIPNFKLILENNSQSCCIGQVVFSDHSWLAKEDFDFFVDAQSQVKLSLEVNTDMLLWDNRFMTTVKIINNSNNLPIYETELSLTTVKHPRIIEIEKFRNQGKYTKAFSLVKQLESKSEKTRTLKKSIVNHRYLTYGLMLIASLFAYIFLGYWVDYQYTYEFSLFPIISIIGFVSASIYLHQYGGKYGKFIDLILSLTAGILVICVLIILYHIIIVLIGLFVLLVFLISGKGKK